MQPPRMDDHVAMDMDGPVHIPGGAIPMSDTKRFSSVADLVDGISDSFSEDYQAQIGSREVIKALQAMRAASGTSQAKIAEELDCTQGRVSKLENGLDGDLKFRHLEAYAKVMGCGVRIQFTKRSETSLDRIKHNSIKIHEELCHLAEIANTDEEIAKGVATTFAEVMLNQMNLLQIAASRLPMTPDTDEPYIHVDCSLEMLRAAEEADDATVLQSLETLPV